MDREPTVREKRLVGPVLVSVAIHSILFVLIGGVVLFPGYVATSPFQGMIDDASVEELVDPPEEFEEFTDEPAGGGGQAGEIEVLETLKQDIAHDFSMDVLTTTALDTAVVLPSGGGISGGEGLLASAGTGGGSGGGNGLGSGKGIGKGTFSGSIGGMKIEAKKLGVVFDVSGSMTGLIPSVSKYINKTFKKSVVVCATQAGFAQGSPDMKRMETWGKYGSLHSYSMGTGAQLLLEQPETPDAIFIFSQWEGISRKGGVVHMRKLGETLYARGIRLYVTWFPGKNVPQVSRPYDMDDGAWRKAEMVELADICELTGGGFSIVRNVDDLFKKSKKEKSKKRGIGTSR